MSHKSETFTHCFLCVLFCRMNFAKTVSAALNIPDWRLFYIRTKDSNVKGCITVKFAIIGNRKYFVIIFSNGFKIIKLAHAPKVMQLVEMFLSTLLIKVSENAADALRLTHKFSLFFYFNFLQSLLGESDYRSRQCLHIPLLVITEFS